MIHMGSDLVIQLLMLYSTSPHGRMLCEEMMTGDPFKVDVQLDNEATNRNAEILNTYLKTIGLRIKFTKKLKQKPNPVKISPIKFSPRTKYYEPVHFYHPDEVPDPKDLEYGLHKYPVLIEPIHFDRPIEEIPTDDYIERIKKKMKEKKK